MLFDCVKLLALAIVGVAVQLSLLVLHTVASFESALAAFCAFVVVCIGGFFVSAALRMVHFFQED